MIFSSKIDEQLFENIVAEGDLKFELSLSASISEMNLYLSQKYAFK